MNTIILRIGSVFGRLGTQLLVLASLTFLTLPVYSAPQLDCVDGSNSVHCGAAPSAVFDSEGSLWVAYVKDKFVLVAKSIDAGATFLKPVAVNELPEDAEHNGENRPKIIVDESGIIFVSWTLKTSPRFTGEIRFARSLDGGFSFEPPRTINDDNLFAGHRFDSLYLTDSGHLYLTWIDKRDLTAALNEGQEYAGASIYYAVSADKGASFSKNYRVANHSCECCRIAIAPRGKDRIAILWRQIFGETTRDHAIALLSPEREVTGFERASYDEWQIDACPHHGPSMIVDLQSDDYHMSWFSNGDAQSGIYYARYSMEDEKPIDVFQVDGAAGAGHPILAAQQGALYLVWKGFDGERTRLQQIISHDAGRTWSEPTTLMSTEQGSDHPLLIKRQSDKALYLSWHTSEYGYVVMPIVEGKTAATEPAVAGQDNRTENTAFLPFTAQTLDEIKTRFKGREFLLGLWSIDCPPCLVELELMAGVLESQPDLPYVLVSTDPIALQDTAAEYLEDYGLGGRESYMFADSFVEKLRFSIDPNWFGELPRSYFFSTDQTFRAHSGIVSEELLAEWFGW